MYLRNILQDSIPTFNIEEGAVADQPLECDRPRGIAMSIKKIVIIHRRFAKNCAPYYVVRVFNRKSPKKILFTIVGTFETPKGVAMDKDECIYVADSGNNRIAKFTSEGKYVNSRGRKDKFGNIAVGFNEPCGLHIVDKWLYVCDSNNSRIQILDLDLNLLYRLGGQHAEPQFLHEPVDIVYNPADSHFYIVDLNRNEIKRIRIEKDFETYYVSKISNLVDSGQKCEFRKMCAITVFNDRILVTQSTGYVLLLTREGELISKQHVEEPADITVNGKTLYVASHKENKIQCFALDPNL